MAKGKPKWERVPDEFTSELIKSHYARTISEENEKLFRMIFPRGEPINILYKCGEEYRAAPYKRKIR